MHFSQLKRFLVENTSPDIGARIWDSVVDVFNLFLSDLGDIGHQIGNGALWIGVLFINIMVSKDLVDFLKTQLIG